MLFPFLLFIRVKRVIRGSIALGCAIACFIQRTTPKLERLRVVLRVDLPQANLAAQRHRGRRFVCSKKPKDPQDEPAGFALSYYGFWWRSSRNVV